MNKIGDIEGFESRFAKPRRVFLDGKPTLDDRNGKARNFGMENGNNKLAVPRKFAFENELYNDVCLVLYLLNVVKCRLLNFVNRQCSRTIIRFAM